MFVATDVPVVFVRFCADDGSNQNNCGEKNRKSRCGQNTFTQGKFLKPWSGTYGVFAVVGDLANDNRPEGATDVTAESKQRKHRGSAVFDACSGEAVNARPHNADREAG